MSTLNELMDKRAQEYSPADIDSIIAYIRKQLASYDAGVKPKREAEESFDVGELIAKMTKGKMATAPEKRMKRRF